MREKSINGPLTVHPGNPRYFADKTGRPVYLTGSHTWANLQDFVYEGVGDHFDFKAHLEWLCSYGHNVTRGWHWEQTTWSGFDKDPSRKVILGPLPYVRTGPGNALDGKPKYDLTKHNDAFFARLRERCMLAGEYGIYMSIMLFEGFSVDCRAPFPVVNPWNGHPYNRANNVNGIDGSAGHPEGGRAVHTLRISQVTRLQEAYVKSVVDAVNDLDNIMYEIGNEHYEDSYEWQCHLVRFIKAYQHGKPKQHLVGMTSGGGSKDAVTNAQLFDSPADWIAPRQNLEEPPARYMDDPPAADGRKVILVDTDHIWGLGGSAAWVWKSITRGLQPILMDPYVPLPGLDEYANGWELVNRRDHPLWEPIRKNLGYTRFFAERMNLACAVPSSRACSTGYCLACRGKEYLIYIPDGGMFFLDLGEGGTFAVTWLDPNTGAMHADSDLNGKGTVPLVAPYIGHAVMFLQRRS